MNFQDEYKVLITDKGDDLEQALNFYSRDGWRISSHQSTLVHIGGFKVLEEALRHTIIMQRRVAQTE